MNAEYRGEEWICDPDKRIKYGGVNAYLKLKCATNMDEFFCSSRGEFVSNPFCRFDDVFYRCQVLLHAAHKDIIVVGAGDF